MAKKFRGVEIVQKIDKMLDLGMARFVTLTQSKLSAATPVLTGRMASSWFVGKNNPNRRTIGPFEDPWASKEEFDTPSIRVTRYDGEIKFDGNWYISSNLPYSFRVAFNPEYSKGGRRGGKDWFTRIENNLSKDADRAFTFFLRQVK